MQLLVFDPDHRGHHAGYILNLLRFLQNGTHRDLHIRLFVSEAFKDAHPDVSSAAKALGRRLEWSLIANSRATRLLGSSSPLIRGLREARMLEQECALYQPDQVLSMYLDYLLFPLAIGQLKSMSISGIVFRQNPHYPSLFSSDLSLRERLKATIRGRILACALKNPALKACLCMDAYLPEWNGLRESREKLHHCPDPVFINSSINRVNGKNPLEHRKTLLLFGVVTIRKGTSRFLRALSLMQPEALRKLRIRIVGPTGETAEEKRILDESNKLRDRNCCIERINTFIKDSDIQPYFEDCDAVLSPYLGHLGMSAIQIRAAAAAKPILSSDFGLMGQLARANQLGLTFNTNSQVSIAAAVKAFLAGKYSFNPESARRFAAGNSPEAFGQLVTRILGIPMENPAVPDMNSAKPAGRTAVMRKS